MIHAVDGLKDEYLGEEKAALQSLENAPRLPSAFAADRLLTDNRGDFSLGGHRLSVGIVPQHARRVDRQSAAGIDHVGVILADGGRIFTSLRGV